MNLLISSIFFLLILLLTFSIIYYIYSYKSPPKDFLPKPESLSKTTTVGTTIDLTNNFFKSSSSTFLGFFKLQPADRTPNIDGSMSILINFGNIFVLEVSPIPKKFYSEKREANEDSSDTTTAQIRIGTVQNGRFVVEIIPLPNLPLQRWVCVGILRDGRRLDVVYDNRIVASKRLIGNFINQSYGPLTVAPSENEKQTKFLGNCVHFFIIPERKTIYEFNNLRAGFVNTNNEVVLDDTSIPIPGLSSLPTINIGNELEQPTAPPKDTMKAWTSPYE